MLINFKSRKIVPKKFPKYFRCAMYTTIAVLGSFYACMLFGYTIYWLDAQMTHQPLIEIIRVFELFLAPMVCSIVVVSIPIFMFWDD